MNVRCFRHDPAPDPCGRGMADETARCGNCQSRLGSQPCRERHCRRHIAVVEDLMETTAQQRLACNSRGPSVSAAERLHGIKWTDLTCANCHAADAGRAEHKNASKIS